MQVLLWKDAVTDRTQRDVETVRKLLEKGWHTFTAQEKEAWQNGLKGALNRADLERVQNNIRLLAEVLELGVEVKDVPKLPKESFYAEVIRNVEAIRNAYCIHADTPATPQAPLNTFQKWNDIEKILLDVYEILLNNFSYYCGNEIYAGDTFGLLL